MFVNDKFDILCFICYNNIMRYTDRHIQIVGDYIGRKMIQNQVSYIWSTKCGQYIFEALIYNNIGSVSNKNLNREHQKNRSLYESWIHRLNTYDDLIAKPGILKIKDDPVTIAKMRMKFRT